MHVDDETERQKPAVCDSDASNLTEVLQEWYSSDEWLHHRLVTNESSRTKGLI